MLVLCSVIAKKQIGNDYDGFLNVKVKNINPLADLGGLWGAYTHIVVYVIKHKV